MMAYDDDTNYFAESCELSSQRWSPIKYRGCGWLVRPIT